MSFRDLLGKELLFFDGAMGTQLQARGLQSGEVPESWNFTHPEDVMAIHRAYIEAGCNILKTNTFGGNGVKLAGSGLEVAAVVRQAVELARRATGGREKTFVALDLGPTGKLLAPYGDLAFEDAVSAYAEVVRAGSAAGADLILIETMSDVYEAKAAILAAKENSDLPVCVTFSFDADGKLLMGSDVQGAAAMAEGLGADAVGFNCGLGPAQLLPLLEQLKQATTLPLIANPNAGMPVSENGRTVFKVGPAEFAELMEQLIKQGLSLAGGCCGTTPEHLQNLIARCGKLPAAGRRDTALSIVSSYGESVVLGGNPVIIGERINPTGKKKLKQAILDRDYDYIARLALEQQEKGAHILDVNMGVPGIDEAGMAAAVVQRLQAIVTTPLQIDTAHPETMERALRIYNGKPLLNSVNGKEESLATVLPIAKKYGAMVVGLCLDEGIPATAAGRLAIAERIIARAEAVGIPRRDILIDPLALTVSTGGNNAAVALEVIRVLKSRGIHTILGVSNISFGLPARDAVNSAFYALALEAGLTAAIINPGSEAMLGTYYAYRALLGLDEACADYVGHFAAAQESAPVPQENAECSLYDAVVKGWKGAAEKAVAALQEEPLEIINGKLIPALNFVGKGFEEKTLFLPQLLMSADAAKAAFEVLRGRMAGADESAGTPFVLATVKGDIHDIGKNIVKVLLQNYGYRVIDLGKDVAAQQIVDAVREYGAPLVGLAALMTTTVPAMEETIKALRGEDCRVIVGGAVLTEDYAARIGADAYARDAVSAVKLANDFKERK